MKKQPITVSALALEKLSELIENRRNTGKSTLGIKVALVSKGCGGNEYEMEYVDEPQKYDEVVEYVDKSGATIMIFIDPKTMFKILGTYIDYEETKFKSGFVFKNPGEKARCGCGKSFYY
ncbi:iron-sulfur cluster assembly accessory family protein [Neorickettsia helminthoeca str. Oregon]|uniref:Iron-sulfur cluster assembly accessory family protein n=1 Tax=Neorickettsia helminthoeca str. Oregon TaxID=1286528 RepID=X5H3U9_9RICK|nr:iron-sulfur cluster assembly accessory protein [Neorickettsia helminthoeca]AHX11241.1 iron-sulfur cluster assembly accessory family protein [Neorickettsia helminthoeca str. Oregon]